MSSGVVLVPCKLCKTKVPVSDLRRNKNGIYVCGNCLNYGSYAKPELRQVTQTRNPLPGKLGLESKKEERIPYLCGSCKFSFTKPFNTEDKTCPNCGKDFSVQRKQSAAEILRNVDDMFGE